MSKPVSPRSSDPHRQKVVYRGRPKTTASSSSAPAMASSSSSPSSSSAHTALEKKIRELETEFEKKQTQTSLEKCSQLLAGIKIDLLTSGLIPPFEDVDVTVEDLLLGRKALEIGALLSLAKNDLKSFSRHVAQLKPYYFDYGAVVPRSDHQWHILGLHLMSLVFGQTEEDSNLEATDFHTELELIPIEEYENKYILFARQVEQRLMDGAYNTILNESKSLPSPYYEYFMKRALDTVRLRIAECVASAYENICVADAKQLLLLDNVDQVSKIAKEKNWIIQGDRISFPKASTGPVSENITPHDLMSKTLQYATELERIV